jgi:hypothetical protein
MNVIPSLADVVRQVVPCVDGSVEISYDRKATCGLSITVCPVDRHGSRPVRRAVRRWLNTLAELGIVVDSLSASVPLCDVASEAGQNTDIDTLRRHLAVIGELGASSLHVSMSLRPGERPDCQQRWLPHAVIASEHDDARFLATVVACDRWLAACACRLLGAGGRIELSIPVPCAASRKSA